MNSMQTLPIAEVYKVHTRQPIAEQNGLKEYPVMKKYVDNNNLLTETSGQQRKPKKKNLRIRTYLDEEEKKHRHIPGPGNYNLQFNWHLPQQKSANPRDRITFLDEVIRKVKRNKSPGPGDYQQNLMNSSKSFSGLNRRHKKQTQRLFYYDQSQYVASKLPGPGDYQVNCQPNTKFKHKMQTPQQNIKNFRAMSQRKLKQLPKLPDIGTYNPQESSFFTSQTAGKIKPLKKSFGVGERFKTQPTGSDLSPNKYDMINKWKGKGSSKKQYQKQGLDMLSRPQPRVYN